MSLQCAVCTLALATVRAESSCGAARCLLAAPPPPLYCNASSHFALVRLASRQCNGRPSSTAKLVPASQVVKSHRAEPAPAEREPTQPGEV